jgi:hypothetical protein
VTDRKAYFAAELVRLEDEWRTGRFPALIEAVALCAWGGHPFPEWAADAAVEQLSRAYNGSPPSAGNRTPQRGRAGGLSARDAQDDQHRLRWATARWALGEAVPGLTAVQRKRARREIQRGMAPSREARAMVRGTRAAAWRVAAAMLGCSPRALEESFELVERAIRSGEGARFKIGAENSAN